MMTMRMVERDKSSKRLIRIWFVPIVVTKDIYWAMILTILTMRMVQWDWLECSLCQGWWLNIYKGPMMIKLMTILTIATRVATNKSLTRLIGLRFVPREGAGTPWSETYNVCHSSAPWWGWLWCKWEKHRKNCECCHHHSLFKGHNVIVHIVVFNCQKCNQCLNSQVSSFRSKISWIALLGCSLNVMANVIVIVHFGHVSSSPWSNVASL